ncbi:hypothetical protein, partial [Oceanivirga salmonicida]
MKKIKEITKVYKDYYLEIIWAIIAMLMVTYNKINLIREDTIDIIFLAMLGYLIIILYKNSLKNKYISTILSVITIGLIIYSVLGLANILFYKQITALIGIAIVSITILELKKNYLLEVIYTKILIHAGIYLLMIIFNILFVMMIYGLFDIKYLRAEILVYYFIVLSGSVVSILYQQDNRKEYFSKKVINYIFIIFLILSLILIYTNIFVRGFKTYYIVTHMIFWVSYLVILLNLTIKKRFIPLTILPIVFYAVYRVYRHILEYGYTENRYFILYFSILLIVFCIMQLLNYFKTITYAYIF